LTAILQVFTYILSRFTIHFWENHSFDPSTPLMFNPTLLTQIDALKARLDRIRPLPPDLVDNLREVYNIRLTYHSNAIEGNTLTQSETQIVIEKGITIGGKPLKDHLEAINHVEAIDFIRDLAMDERAITEWDIRQIHGLVCKGERSAGAYRTVNVMAAGSNYRYPDAIMVPELMQGFGDWLHSNPALHPVEIATEIHYRLFTIHPFQDGNGRTARLLMNLSLLRLKLKIALLISMPLLLGNLVEIIPRSRRQLPDALSLHSWKS
jgi:Fic family protein